MNNAPVVFLPTEPESNGLTLPMLLSLLAHGLILGLLIYNYQTPTIETAGSVETTMVSPEQLAQMQGQILANRAVAASGQQTSGDPSDSSNSETASEPVNPNVYTSDSSSRSQTSQPSSRSVPVFLQSDDAADTPILMSQERQDQYARQSEEYQRNLAEWSAEQQAITDERLARVEQRKQQDDRAINNRLKEFQDKQLNPPKIERPKSNQRNIEITSGSSGSTGKSFSLSDGESTISGDTSTTSTQSGDSRSAGGSSGASNSEIVNLIRRYYKPPVAAKGSTQRTTLTITVRSNGDVASVTASGPDSAVNEAARQAVLSTGNLPIDTDDPKYPTFNVQFKGSN